METAHPPSHASYGGTSGAGLKAQGKNMSMDHDTQELPNNIYYHCP
jgi:hypothetical protein